jgi:hypothetical protein
VLCAVEADASSSFGRRKQPHCVVLPNRTNRESDQLGELVDGYLLLALGCRCHD